MRGVEQPTSRMGREIASLERDAGVWRESYLALDDERNQLSLSSLCAPARSTAAP